MPVLLPLQREDDLMPIYVYKCKSCGAVLEKVRPASKMKETFGNPPMDGKGLVYPPYRMHGTGTGRPAGGDDEELHEKGVGVYKFNALNIPDEMRQIYVPYEERV